MLGEGAVGRAHARIGTGTQLGIDQFLLAQWFAPLASEAPEFIARSCSPCAERCRCDRHPDLQQGIVGSLPLTYLLGGGTVALHLDARQVEEFLLTATQTLPGVAALLALRFPRWLRWTLLGLFAVQFALPARPDGAARLCGIYTAIAVATLIRNRRHIPPTLTAPSQPWPSTQTTSRPHVRPSTVTAAC